jgi:hypothetical protein
MDGLSEQDEEMSAEPRLGALSCACGGNSKAQDEHSIWFYARPFNQGADTVLQNK